MVDFFKTTKLIKSKEGKVHFRRFSLVSSKGRGLFLHIFRRGDQDKHLHDHPWDYWTFVLYGGYSEIYKEGNREEVRVNLFASLNRHLATYAHRVAKLHGKISITLVGIGKRKREWGYWVGNEWMTHKTYRERKRSGEFLES